jgi:hypothetical protein
MDQFLGGRPESQTTKTELPPSVSFHNARLHHLLTETNHNLQRSAPEDCNPTIRRTFRARLVPGIERLKFGSFCREWGARFISQDQNQFTYHIELPVSFYHRLLGRKPIIITVQFALMRPKSAVEPLTVIDVEVGCTGCDSKSGSRLLNTLGQIILISIPSHFHAHPERRVQARIALGGPICFYPVLPTFRPNDVLDASCKDISVGGMRFWSSNFPASSHVGINLPASGDGEPVSLLGRVLRVLPAGDGGFEISVAFPQDMP